MDISDSFIEYYSSEEYKNLSLERKKDILKKIDKDPWLNATYGVYLDEIFSEFGKHNKDNPPLNGRPEGGEFLSREDFINAGKPHFRYKRYLDQKTLAIFMGVKPKTIQRHQKKFGFKNYREYVKECKK